MICVALKVRPVDNHQTIAARLTAIGKNDLPAVAIVDEIMADTSMDALKERVRTRIRRHPDERWTILSGTQIAEYQSPPIQFRQW